LSRRGAGTLSAPAERHAREPAGSGWRDRKGMTSDGTDTQWGGEGSHRVRRRWGNGIAIGERGRGWPIHQPRAAAAPQLTKESQCGATSARGGSTTPRGGGRAPEVEGRHVPKDGYRSCGRGEGLPRQGDGGKDGSTIPWGSGPPARCGGRREGLPWLRAEGQSWASDAPGVIRWPRTGDTVTGAVCGGRGGEVEGGHRAGGGRSLVGR